MSLPKFPWVTIFTLLWPATALSDHLAACASALRGAREPPLGPAFPMAASKRPRSDETEWHEDVTAILRNETAILRVKAVQRHLAELTQLAKDRLQTLRDNEAARPLEQTTAVDMGGVALPPDLMRIILSHLDSAFDDEMHVCSRQLLEPKLLLAGTCQAWRSAIAGPVWPTLRLPKAIANKGATTILQFCERERGRFQATTHLLFPRSLPCSFKIGTTFFRKLVVFLPQLHTVDVRTFIGSNGGSKFILPLVDALGAQLRGFHSGCIHAGTDWVHFLSCSKLEQLTLHSLNDDAMISEMIIEIEGLQGTFGDMRVVRLLVTRLPSLQRLVIGGTRGCHVNANRARAINLDAVRAQTPGWDTLENHPLLAHQPLYPGDDTASAPYGRSDKQLLG